MQMRLSFLKSSMQENKSVLSLVPRLSTRRYPHLLLSAGACSKYRSIAGTLCPQGAQQQTSRTPLLLSIDGTDRQMKTPDRCRDAAPHTMLAVSTNMPCEQRLNTLYLESLEHRRLVTDLTLVYQIVHGHYDT